MVGKTSTGRQAVWQARQDPPIGWGSKVPLAAPEGKGRAIEFTMVEWEDSDPTKGRISVDAPVARAGGGRNVGEEVVVPAPRGERRYRIVSAV